MRHTISFKFQQSVSLFPFGELNVEIWLSLIWKFHWRSGVILWNPAAILVDGDDFLSTDGAGIWSRGFAILLDQLLHMAAVKART